MMKDIKFMFIGRHGVGKTTLKKFFFELNNPLKLLKQNLAPTMGVEITNYSIETEVSVHDLSGQELNYWLRDGEDIFVESDIIFLVIDANDTWEEQTDLIHQIMVKSKKICPKSTLAVIFHKIDLLNESKLNSLRKKIENDLPKQGLKFILTSSISKSYYAETFSSFLRILKRTLKNVVTINFNEIMEKISILEDINSHPNYTLDKIKKKYLISEDIENPMLKDLIDSGFILTDSEKNTVFTSIKAKNAVNFFSSNFAIENSTHDSDKLKTDSIKALILFRQDCRNISYFETESDFFLNLLSNDSEIDSKPEFLGMFFSAIISFVRNIDQTGVSQLNLQSRSIKIVLINNFKFSCIFFLEKTNLDPNICNNLKIYGEKIKHLIEDNENHLDTSRMTSKKNLNTSFSAEIRKKILKLIKNADEELQYNKQYCEDIPNEKIIKIYDRVKEKNFKQEDLVILKKILFTYLISS